MADLLHNSKEKYPSPLRSYLTHKFLRRGFSPLSQNYPDWCLGCLVDRPCGILEPHKFRNIKGLSPLMPWIDPAWKRFQSTVTTGQRPLWHWSHYPIIAGYYGITGKIKRSIIQFQIIEMLFQKNYYSIFLNKKKIETIFQKICS